MKLKKKLQLKVKKIAMLQKKTGRKNTRNYK